MTSTDAHRSVSLTRTSAGRFTATNARGGTLDFGSGEDEQFTPVELLLTAIAGCSAIDVDIFTSRRSEPEQFDVVAEGDKLRDEQGNHMGRSTSPSPCASRRVKRATLLARCTRRRSSSRTNACAP